LARDPAAVLEDVIDGRVSVAAARDEYGVVLDASGDAVDVASTATLRNEIAGER
jgi:N-methylhydantoinase B